ncbi:hypothetical protein P154DRAFT_573787 [Amniculicola lignicola CBS 123094]|uniref:Uncharacterized protein n=1 Tax=Amniculicola lignicola CBS 123094 TaxID=1392246 RepID=A0A6A5WNW9_9PLEO|nr:hypothetical protein P154DRAFT_573787 [Amniculicola lignicola CBS 123094]
MASPPGDFRRSSSLGDLRRSSSPPWCDKPPDHQSSSKPTLPPFDMSCLDEEPDDETDSTAARQGQNRDSAQDADLALASPISPRPMSKSPETPSRTIQIENNPKVFVKLPMISEFKSAPDGYGGPHTAISITHGPDRGKFLHIGRELSDDQWIWTTDALSYIWDPSLMGTASKIGMGSSASGSSEGGISKLAFGFIAKEHWSLLGPPQVPYPITTRVKAPFAGPHTAIAIGGAFFRGWYIHVPRYLTRDEITIAEENVKDACNVAWEWGAQNDTAATTPLKMSDIILTKNKELYEEQNTTADLLEHDVGLDFAAQDPVQLFEAGFKPVWVDRNLELSYQLPKLPSARPVVSTKEESPDTEFSHASPASDHAFGDLDDDDILHMRDEDIDSLLDEIDSFGLGNLNDDEEETTFRDLEHSGNPSSSAISESSLANAPLASQGTENVRTEKGSAVKSHLNDGDEWAFVNPRRRMRHSWSSPSGSLISASPRPGSPMPIFSDPDDRGFDNAALEMWQLEEEDRRYHRLEDMEMIEPQLNEPICHVEEDTVDGEVVMPELPQTLRMEPEDSPAHGEDQQESSDEVPTSNNNHQVASQEDEPVIGNNDVHSSENVALVDVGEGQLSSDITKTCRKEVSGYPGSPEELGLDPTVESDSDRIETVNADYDEDFPSTNTSLNATVEEPYMPPNAAPVSGHLSDDDQETVQNIPITVQEVDNDDPDEPNGFIEDELDSFSDEDEDLSEDTGNTINLDLTPANDIGNTLTLGLGEWILDEPPSVVNQPSGVDQPTPYSPDSGLIDTDNSNLIMPTLPLLGGMNEKLILEDRIKVLKEAALGRTAEKSAAPENGVSDQGLNGDSVEIQDNVAETQKNDAETEKVLADNSQVLTKNHEHVTDSQFTIVPRTHNPPKVRKSPIEWELSLTDDERFEDAYSSDEDENTTEPVVGDVPQETSIDDTNEEIKPTYTLDSIKLIGGVEESDDTVHDPEFTEARDEDINAPTVNPATPNIVLNDGRSGSPPAEDGKLPNTVEPPTSTTPKDLKVKEEPEPKEMPIVVRSTSPVMQEDQMPRRTPRAKISIIFICLLATGVVVGIHFVHTEYRIMVFLPRLNVEGVLQIPPHQRGVVYQYISRSVSIYAPYQREDFDAMQLTQPCHLDTFSVYSLIMSGVNSRRIVKVKTLLPPHVLSVLATARVFWPWTYAVKPIFLGIKYVVWNSTFFRLWYVSVCGFRVYLSTGSWIQALESGQLTCTEDMHTILVATAALAALGWATRCCEDSKNIGVVKKMGRVYEIVVFGAAVLVAVFVVYCTLDEFWVEYSTVWF